jgi:hypothetical protein
MRGNINLGVQDELAASSPAFEALSSSPPKKDVAPTAAGGAADVAAFHAGLATEVEDTEEEESITTEDIDDAETEQATDGSQSSRGKLMDISLKRQVIPVHTVNNVAYFKSAYYGNIQVGSPAQSYKMVFDTGSGHLILPSRYCFSETCRAHQRYSRSASNSAVDMDYDGNVVSLNDPRDQITVNFGTGEVTGIFIQEIVCLEDAALGAWTPEELSNLSGTPSEHHPALPVGCMSMRFIAATAMSEDPFKTFEFDGVLGLGLPGISQAQPFNFVDVLAQNSVDWGVKNKDKHIFAVFLADDGNAGSEISFGGYHEDHLDGELSWNDVLHPEDGHWMLRIKSLKVDNDTVDFCSDGTCKAVADTGTSLLGVPVDSFSTLYRLMWHPSPEDGMCSGVGPELHFELDTITITMTPADYAHISGYSPAAIKANSEVPPPWGRPFSGGEEDRFGKTRFDVQCKPMLMSMDHPEPIGPKLFILGEPVLRKYYSVYDAENKKIGFGKSKHEGEEAESPPEPDNMAWLLEDLHDDE